VIRRFDVGTRYNLLSEETALMAQEAKPLETLRHPHRSRNFWLIVCGLIISLLNMGAAWYLINSSNKFVMTGLVSSGGTSATSEALKGAFFADADKLTFLNRVVENDVNHRNIANKQTTVIVAVAASFSLIALGFALFVMGFEAAYTISGNSPGGSLVIQAASPGLLCFVLAALVICFAITRRTDVRFAPMELSKRVGQVLVSEKIATGTSSGSPTPRGTATPEVPSKFEYKIVPSNLGPGSMAIDKDLPALNDKDWVAAFDKKVLPGSSQ
jgi:hypothetical protein